MSALLEPITPKLTTSRAATIVYEGRSPTADRTDHYAFVIVFDGQPLGVTGYAKALDPLPDVPGEKGLAEVTSISVGMPIKDYLVDRWVVSEVKLSLPQQERALPIALDIFKGLQSKYYEISAVTETVRFI